MLLIYKGMSLDQNDKIEVGDIVRVVRERFPACSGGYTLYKEGTLCKVKEATKYGSLMLNIEAVDIGTLGTFHSYKDGIYDWYETKNGKERRGGGWWYAKDMVELVEKNPDV